MGSVTFVNEDKNEALRYATAVDASRVVMATVHVLPVDFVMQITDTLMYSTILFNDDLKNWSMAYSPLGDVPLIFMRYATLGCLLILCIFIYFVRNDEQNMYNPGIGWFLMISCKTKQLQTVFPITKIQTDGWAG